MLKKFTENLKNLLGSKQDTAEIKGVLEESKQGFLNNEKSLENSRQMPTKQEKSLENTRSQGTQSVQDAQKNSRFQGSQNLEDMQDFEEENLSLPTLANDDEIAILASFFAVFSDSTRLKIIHALSQNELCVHELTTLLGLKQPTISQHLKVLWQARVVSKRKVGLHAFYRCDDEHIEKIYALAFEHIREANA